MNLDDGSSASDPSLIGTKACESFSSMFKAGHGNPSSTLLNCIPSLVTRCMNENLCGIPTENEIFEAVPLDGLLIPGALLSLCILLCLNRINLIRSDGNLLSWLLAS